MVDLMLARNHPQVWCQSCTRMFKLTTQVVQRGFQREYAVALSAISVDCLSPGRLQRAKKVISDSPGLVDFAIRLVNSVFNLQLIV